MTGTRDQTLHTEFAFERHLSALRHFTHPLGTLLEDVLVYCTGLVFLSHFEQPSFLQYTKMSQNYLKTVQIGCISSYNTIYYVNVNEL